RPRSRPLCLADRQRGGAFRLRFPCVPPSARLLHHKADRMTIIGTRAQSPAALMAPGRPLMLAGVPPGPAGPGPARLSRAVAAQQNAPATSLMVVCRDGNRMAQLARALAFFAPDVGILEFPAWDCLPYDRASPLAGLMAQRMTALSRLAHLKEKAGPQSRPSV